MARENDARILRSRLVVMQALWNHEREQILEVEEINAHAWSTETLVEEIQDCIEGHKMLASVATAKQKPTDQADALSDELSREETEDWLNDMPLFE